MLTVFLGVVVGFSIFYSKFKLFIDDKKIKEQYDLTNFFKKFIGQKWLFIYLLIFLISIMIALYYSPLFLHYQENWFALGILMFFSTLGDFFKTVVLYTAYFSKTRFYYNSQMIPYKHIRSFQSRKSPLTVDMILYDKKRIAIPLKFADIIEEKV